MWTTWEQWVRFWTDNIFESDYVFVQEWASIKPQSPKFSYSPAHHSLAPIDTTESWYLSEIKMLSYDWSCHPWVYGSVIFECYSSIHLSKQLRQMLDNLVSMVLTFCQRPSVGVPSSRRINGLSPKVTKTRLIKTSGKCLTMMMPFFIIIYRLFIENTKIINNIIQNITKSMNSEKMGNCHFWFCW